MKDIDQAVFDRQPFVLPQQSAVCIRADEDGTVVGELAHIAGTDPVTRLIIQQFTR